MGDANKEALRCYMRSVFDRRAPSDGDESTLSKAELKILLEQDMAKFPKDSAALDKLIKQLDDDGDAKINFEELMSFAERECGFSSSQEQEQEQEKQQCS